MWVAQDYTPHYEPRATADKHLRDIAQKHIDLATEALKQRRLSEAEKQSSVALAADDRMVGSMIVKAAICHINNDPTGVKVMAMVAEDLMTGESFLDAVKALASRVPAPEKKQFLAHTIADSGSMHHMACER